MPQDPANDLNLIRWGLWGAVPEGQAGALEPSYQPWASRRPQAQNLEGHLFAPAKKRRRIVVAVMTATCARGESSGMD